MHLAKLHKPIGFSFLCIAMLLQFGCHPAASGRADLIVKKTTDFTIDGTGSASQWSTTEWNTINTLPNYFSTYQTSFKLLYSGKGLYVLFTCTDSILTNTIQEDGKALYTEDVIEIFLQPDTSVTHYFEYELSPLGFETPLLIYNYKGELNSWQPFEPKEPRKIQHATQLLKGNKAQGATITGWTAECFIPFELLRPLGGANPESGKRWKANLYRIDYDKGEALWTWKKNSGNFHEFQHFGTIEFE